MFLDIHRLNRSTSINDSKVVNKNTSIHKENNNSQKTIVQQRIRDAEVFRQEIKQYTEEKMYTVLKNLKNMQLPVNHTLSYSVDFKSKEVIVKIIDKTSNEVIKEFPSMATRRLHERIQEFIGVLFDKKV